MEGGETMLEELMLQWTKSPNTVEVVEPVTAIDLVSDEAQKIQDLAC